MEYLQKNQSLQNIFIIGGMSIYKHFYDYADTLHITFIGKVLIIQILFSN